MGNNQLVFERLNDVETLNWSQKLVPIPGIPRNPTDFSELRPADLPAAVTPTNGTSCVRVSTPFRPRIAIGPRLAADFPKNPYLPVKPPVSRRDGRPPNLRRSHPNSAGEEGTPPASKRRKTVVFSDWQAI